jgi:hypothetical protein
MEEVLALTQVRRSLHRASRPLEMTAGHDTTGELAKSRAKIVRVVALAGQVVTAGLRSCPASEPRTACARCDRADDRRLSVAVASANPSERSLFHGQKRAMSAPLIG